ncbi:hypothetical protein ACQKDD_16370 [Planococcus kocurii]|nr:MULTISPECIES: hypothetical protein [Planococcus]
MFIQGALGRRANIRKINRYVVPVALWFQLENSLPQSNLMELNKFLGTL